MSKLNLLVTKIEQYKSYMWGLLLSSVVAKHAVGNVILIALGLCFIIQLVANRQFKFRKSYALLIVYFLFGTLSLFWTTNIDATLSGVSKGLYFFLIPVFLSQYKSFSIDDLRKMLHFTGVVLLVYFLFSLINSVAWFIEDGNVNHFFYHDLTSISGNNAIYISSIVSSVFLLLFNLKNKTKLDNYICLGLLIYLLMLLSKSLIIITFLIQLFLSLRRIRTNFSKHKALFFLGAFVLLIVGVLFIENPLKDRFLDLSIIGADEVWKKDDFLGQTFNGLTIRLFQWRIIGEIFLSGSIGLGGLGWNNIDYLSTQYFSYYNFYKGYFNINFHNQYLQTFGELGFIGFSILCSLLLINFKKIRRENVYLTIFTLISLISFVTESYLSRQKGVIIFVIFYCVLVSLNKSGTFKNVPLDNN